MKLQGREWCLCGCKPLEDEENPQRPVQVCSGLGLIGSLQRPHLCPAGACGSVRWAPQSAVSRRVYRTASRVTSSGEIASARGLTGVGGSIARIAPRTAAAELAACSAACTRDTFLRGSRAPR